MEKIKLGITIGDINGIGPEVIIKALSDTTILKQFTPIIYGSTKVLTYHKSLIKDSSFNYMAVNSLDNIAHGKINVVNCWENDIEFSLGKASKEGGIHAQKALDKATDDLAAGLIDGLVTAPINKSSMHLSDFPYPGHTEYLTNKLGQGKSLMMMCSPSLKVALVTNHLAVSEVSSHITKNAIQTKLDILHKTLIEDFGVEKPIISILGLNPHAGDDGVIGNEEDDIIKPVIETAKKAGKIVMGPYAADGFFGSAQFKKADAILAMYHDQGLIPFKAISFGSGVNLTAGLDYIRTSPDHGTGYDIVGKDKADASSMRAAIYLAIDTIRNRKQYKSDRANKLKPSPNKNTSRERG